LENLQKLEFEYPVNASPRILYNYLHAPSGLTEWFCDEVKINDGIYTFYWGEEERSAKLVSSKLNKFIQFRWLDLPKDTYFEFRLDAESVTKGVFLFITDFEPQSELENSKLLWDSQINRLLQCVGA
jgi:uncharacterized protein YndB with AHSA1/START domain